MPNLRFKDVNLFYTVTGSGPTVVLLHGFLEHMGMWDFILPKLKLRHRVICIDLPGHGQSDCIGYVHTMDEMAEAVLAVTKALRVRRFSLVGHSMGGYVALAAAELNPDALRSLCLYHSTARADSEEKKADRLKAIDLVKSNHKSFVRKSIPYLFRAKNRTRLKDEIAALKEEALNTSRQGIAAALSGMRTRPNREILLKFPPFPVYIIAGDRDPRIPLKEAQELAAISEMVHLSIIPDTGHMSFIEAPDEAIRHIQRAVR